MTWTEKITMAYLPTALLLWCALGLVLQRFPWARNWRAQAVLGIAALTIATLPIKGIALAGWFLGFVPGLSIPTLAWLLDGILRQAGGRGLINEPGRLTLWAFVAVGGFFLYPSALGLGRFDSYALGWGFSWLTIALGALALILVTRGNHSGTVLLVALLAWQARLTESLNLWDYLVDPLVFAFSLVMLPLVLMKRKQAASPGLSEQSITRPPPSADA